MNLVKQRIKWEYEYAFGKTVEFQAFLDYKKYRHTEDFRLNSGLLRSPSLANILHKEFGFNTRAVGCDKEYALIPISQALIWWADEIIFVNRENFDSLNQEEKDEIADVGAKVTILNIEDDFDWNDSVLNRTLLEAYNRT